LRAKNPSNKICMLMSGLRLSDLNKETTYLLTYLLTYIKTADTAHYSESGEMTTSMLR